MYVQGKTIVNQPIVQLTSNPQSNDRIVSYVPTSTQVDVTTRGTSALSNGQIFVAFDDKFRQLINPNEPIIINITIYYRITVFQVSSLVQSSRSKPG